MTYKRTQFDRFTDTARELECDEDEARWEEHLKKLAKDKLEGRIANG